MDMQYPKISPLFTMTLLIFTASYPMSPDQQRSSAGSAGYQEPAEISGREVNFRSLRMTLWQLAPTIDTQPPHDSYISRVRCMLEAIPRAHPPYALSMLHTDMQICIANAIQKKEIDILRDIAIGQQEQNPELQEYLLAQMETCNLLSKCQKRQSAAPQTSTSHISLAVCQHDSQSARSAENALCLCLEELVAPRETPTDNDTPAALLALRKKLFAGNTHNSSPAAAPQSPEKQDASVATLNTHAAIDALAKAHNFGDLHKLSDSLPEGPSKQYAQTMLQNMKGKNKEPEVVADPQDETIATLIQDFAAQGNREELLELTADPSISPANQLLIDQALQRIKPRTTSPVDFT